MGTKFQSAAFPPALSTGGTFNGVAQAISRGPCVTETGWLLTTPQPDLFLFLQGTQPDWCFPASLAVRRGHVTEFWPMGFTWKSCAPPETSHTCSFLPCPFPPAGSKGILGAGRLLCLQLLNCLVEEPLTPALHYREENKLQLHLKSLKCGDLLVRAASIPLTSKLCFCQLAGGGG